MVNVSCHSNQSSYPIEKKRTIGPVSLTWVLRICRIRTNLEINTQCCISFQPCRSIRKQIAAYQLSLALWFQRRRFFKIFTIYGHGGHIGHVTQTIWTNFHSPIPLSHGGATWNLASIGLEVSKEKKLENVNLSDHEWRSIDLWYSYRLMYSFSLLHLPTLTSQTTTVLEKSIVLPFSHTKAKGTKFDLAIK